MLIAAYYIKRMSNASYKTKGAEAPFVNRMGIGTTAPASKLDVNGVARIRAGNSWLFFNDDNTSYAGIRGNGTGAANNNLIFSTNSEAMRLNSSGNLGIGTSSPVYQTQIYGSGQTTAALTDAGNKGGSLLLNTPTVAAGDGGALLLGAGGSGAKPFAAIKGLLTDGGGNTTGAIAFSTRNAIGDTALTERMRIDSSGNLGVGTSSPGVKLDVVNASGRVARIGGFQFAGTGSSTDGGNNLLSSGVYWNGSNLTATQTSGAVLQFGNGALQFQTLSGLTAGSTYSFAPQLSLDSSGNLGIGTSSPAAKLNTAGNSSANQVPDIQITRSSSGTAIQTGPNITFSDGTTNNTTTLQVTQGRFGVWNYGAGAWNERMSIDSSGNLGLGVTPSAWSAIKAMQFAGGVYLGSFTASATPNLYLGTNNYFNGSNFIYSGSYAASRYDQSAGAHRWYTAPSGTSTPKRSAGIGVPIFI